MGVGPAKFDLNRYNESPCGAKNLIFGLWLKTIPAVYRYAAILPVTMHRYNPRKS